MHFRNRENKKKTTIIRWIIPISALILGQISNGRSAHLFWNEFQMVEVHLFWDGGSTTKAFETMVFGKGTRYWEYLKGL